MTHEKTLPSDAARTVALPPDPARGDPGAAGAPALPAAIGRYEIRGLLGEGGMGRVYRAWDGVLAREVALKVLHAPGSDLSRFLGEARAQARVSHPNVAKVYEAGLEGERPFIAMQLVEGPSLERIAPELSPRAVATLVRDVADGVEAANRLGLVHRDLKPTNILVERRADGTLHPYVVDFGLVRDLDATRITVTGSTVGTPAFMAPEQAAGETAAIGIRTDVYGLGATLYAAVAGRPPFEGAGPLETMTRVVRDEPEPLRRVAPGVPADLATIAGKCLEKAPDRRYASAAEVARDLGRFLAGEPISARPQSAIYRLAMRARRNRLAVGVAAAALVAIGAVGGLALRERLHARRQAELAREFGGMVERIESELRQSYLLPPHDIRPARRRVEERILSLEVRMRVLGRDARAPGSYAIGRALLALRRPEAAIARLSEAWNAGDHRAENAYALALAHARRFQEELLTLAAVKNPVLREARRKDAIGRYRDPALRWLGETRRTDPVEEAYAAALLAHLAGQPDRAIAKAREAFARSEGFYEARLLEADVEAGRAADQMRGGTFDAARASLERAEAAALVATRIGESDPSTYETGCDVRSTMSTVDLYVGADAVEAGLPGAVAACEAVLRVDPESARALRRLGGIYRVGAESRLRNARDPGELLDKALQASLRGVALEPDDASGLSQLGAVWQVKGRREANAGGDPRGSFGEAVRTLVRATERHPGFEAAHNSLGVTWWYRAQWETAHGLDPRASLDAAVSALKRATELLPGYAFAWVNLGGVLNDRGAWETSRGLDPAATLEDAAAAFGKALALAGGMADAWNNSGVTWLYAADHARLGGRDPHEPVARALAAFEKAVQITPTLFAARFNRGQALRYEASFRVQAGLEPEPGLGEARRALEELVAAETYSTEALIELGAVHVAGARWAARRGSSPAAELAAAKGCLERALRADPRLAHGQRGLADAALAEARWLAAQNRPAGAALEAARRALEAAAALDPGHVELAILRRELLDLGGPAAPK